MGQLPHALVIPGAASSFAYEGTRRGDDITELCSVASGRVLDREHVAYRVRVRRSGRDYLVEQQAYYCTEGPRITWMRILCSGYQPVPG